MRVKQGIVVQKNDIKLNLNIEKKKRSNIGMLVTALNQFKYENMRIIIPFEYNNYLICKRD